MLNQINLIRALLLLCFFTTGITSFANIPLGKSASGKPWNVIFLLVDDLGWTDLGYSGSDFHKTPNIDKLAKSGMIFTNGYSACTVCSPTRAALMTGMYPARLHVTDFINGANRKNPKLLIPKWTKYLEQIYL